jgi:hypothetical protein
MPPRPRDAHDALVDAKHNLRRYRLMTADDDDGSWAVRSGAAGMPCGVPDGRWRKRLFLPATMDG